MSMLSDCIAPGYRRKFASEQKTVRIETSVFDAQVLPDRIAADKQAKIRLRTNVVRVRANVFRRPSDKPESG
jgi:hypothetical protein